MLRFKARRKSPALKPLGELTPSEKRIVRIISDAMEQLRREVTRMETRLIDAVAHRSANQIVNMIGTEAWLDIQESLQEELLGELLDAGSRVQLPAIRKEVLSYSFDRSREESARWAANEAGQLIREISDGQRDMVKDLISRAQLSGISPSDVAREIRNGIGLTSTQAQWVSNFYERNLTDNIANGLSMSAAVARAQSATDRYQTQVHRYRASTIARTEIMRANSEGRQEAWRQGAEGGWISPNAEKEWIAEPDACEICEALNGTRVALTDEFSEGEPPAHPNCRCDVLLVDEVPQDIQDMTDEELDTEIARLMDQDSAISPSTDPGLSNASKDVNAGSSCSRIIGMGGVALEGEGTGGWTCFNDNTDAPDSAALRVALNGTDRDNDIVSALSSYQGSSPQFNAVLRGQVETTPRKDKVIAAIRNAIEKSDGLDEDTLLFRGIRGYQGDVSNLTSGTIFEDAGFVSTSFSRKVGQKFATIDEPDGYRGWLMIIQAPKGTKGVPMTRYRTDNPKFRDEHEYLLGPSRFRVLKRDDVTRTIVVEVYNG